jgi:hypothetical protein
MEVISPINLQSCSPHIGKQVCAVMRDGTQIIGYLNRVDNERLYLSASPQVQEEAATKGRKKKKLAKGKAAEAQASFVNPYFYPGEIALDLALITLLFIIPFVV